MTMVLLVGRSMASTLASLDLGHNEFMEVPIEALRELKVLNWLNLQKLVVLVIFCFAILIVPF